MEEANKFPEVSHTNVPLLSVVVRHHILEGSQLVGQSLNQLVAQSVSLLGQSVSQSCADQNSMINNHSYSKEQKSGLNSLVNSNVLEIWRSSRKIL